eukprot:1160957-Pelagomonas_calceolata.AAC.3
MGWSETRPRSEPCMGDGISQGLDGFCGCPSNVMHLMPHAYICAHTRLYQQLPSLKHYNASMAVDAEN